MFPTEEWLKSLGKDLANDLLDGNVSVEKRLGAMREQLPRHYDPLVFHAVLLEARQCLVDKALNATEYAVYRRCLELCNQLAVYFTLEIRLGRSLDPAMLHRTPGLQ